MTEALGSQLEGNPSSGHAAGRAIRALLDQAREQIAAGIGAAPADVVLTSGGTEACNLAIRGLCGVPWTRHLVTSALEHPAVLEPIGELEREGVEVTRLNAPSGVVPDSEVLQRALREDTHALCVQWVNHETGATLPLEQYAAVCRERGVLLIVDGTQALGKLPFDVDRLGATAVAVAGHKAGGPAGSGALWIERGANLRAHVVGGGQERGRRAGTPDVLAAVGFGAACTAMGARLAAQPRIGQQRDRLEAALVALGAVANGAGPRTATACNLSFTGWQGRTLAAALDLEGLCVSAGAACSSGLDEPSAVIAAMHGPERARAALRFSLGPETTDAELQQAVEIVRRVLGRPAT